MAADAGHSVCGNGVVEPGEQCDDGPDTDSTSTCYECKIQQCGGATFQTTSAAPGFYQIANDFTLPTLSGDWNFKDHYTGCDSYVFILTAEGFEYGNDLWDGSFETLLGAAPADAQYFFVSYDGTAMQEAQAKQQLFQSFIAGSAALTKAWKDRVHFVTSPVNQLSGWLSPWLLQEGVGTFAIDHEQRLRESGYVGSPLTGSVDVSYFNYLTQGFDFEFSRDQQLAAEQGVTVIPMIAPEQMGDAGVSSPSLVDVTLPPASEMAQMRTMEFDLTSGCSDNEDKNCPAWDQIGSLDVCAPDSDAGTCEDGVEIARWITTYGRIGRWVTDDSPFLAMLQGGGTRRFQYNSGGGSMATLTMRLSKGTGPQPMSYQYLWGGGSLSATYDSDHAPITFTVPAGTTRVQFAAFVTGHGWGWDVNNCAEFCDITQQIAVNGNAAHVKDNPLAGTEDGCAQQVPEGAIPNQYGTWPLGRDGWCPGLDVKPWTVDITSEVNLNGSNTITYDGYFMGMNYTPVESSSANPSGFPPQIDMSSYLIFSK